MSRAFRAFTALMVVLACAAMLGALAGAQEKPYNNSSGNVSQEGWTDGHEDVTLENVSHYMSRVGTFVIGEDANDAGVGPIFAGILVGALAISAMGTSRAGLVASGTMSVVVAAGLSGGFGAGLLPGWLFGVLVMLVALIGGVIYIRMMR